MSKAVHIEFYGLPGCGKSTVSHILADKLRNKGLKVSEPSYAADHELRPFVRKLSKLMRTAGYCLSKPVRAAKIKELVELNGYKGLGKSFQQINNIVQKLKIYNSSAGIMIWDEGLVQAAVSLSVEGVMSSADNERALRKMIPTNTVIKKIYIKETIPTVKERMRSRGTKDSRVERLGDEKAVDRWLKEFEKACDSVETSDRIIIEGIADVNEIADTITKELGAFK